MKTLIRHTIFLLFMLAAMACFLNPLMAQQATPEFRLDLHYTDAGGSFPADPVAFGYDPSATDTVDPQFGEMLYPGAGGPFGFYLAFQVSSEDGMQVDILHKPSLDSFILQYKLFLSANMYPAVLSWDRSKIPSSIMGIWITPNGDPSYKMADMVTQDSVVIDNTNPSDTNYAINWETAIFTLYYNTVPHVLAVSNSATPTTGLLSDLALYPNPMSGSGFISFLLSEPSYISIVGSDAAGREVLRLTRNASPGENTIDLSSLANAHGAIFLRVNAESDSHSETKNVVLMKE